MSDWPPKPENEVQNTQHNSQNITGKEWHILEKAVLASVEEQRRARRWGIFFKFLTFAYILFILVVLGKSCSTSSTDATATTARILLWWILLAPLPQTSKVSIALLQSRH